MGMMRAIMHGLSGKGSLGLPGFSRQDLRVVSEQGRTYFGPKLIPPS